MAVPSAVLNLRVVGGTGYADLTWDAPASDGGSPILYYSVERFFLVGGARSPQVPPETRSYRISEVRAGDYFVYVVAYNADGRGHLADPNDPDFEGGRSVTVSAPVVPTVPQNVEATAGTDYIDISWEAPENDGGRAVSGYKITFAPAGGASATLSVPVSTSYRITRLLAGDYSITVRAVNAVGDGADSDAQVVTVTTGTTVTPVVPEGRTGQRIWTEPITWAHNELFDAFDGNAYVRDNLVFLVEEAESANLLTKTYPTVTTASNSLGWRTIDTFTFRSYGKEIYAYLEFNVVQGQDVWKPGTVVVGTSNVLRKVEKDDGVITRVAIIPRKFYGRWDSYDEAIARAQRKVEELQDRVDYYRRLGNTQYVYLTTLELIDAQTSLGHRRGELHVYQQRFYRNIFGPGIDRDVVETTQTTTTSVVTAPFTETYDKAFLRMVFDGESVRELVGEGDDRTSSGVFYIQGIGPGDHTIQLQWNTPQFGGQTPSQSETLVSLSNVTLQLKEIRYRLIQDVS